MYIESVLYYSNILNKDMRVNIYGTAGLPLLCFPAQNSMANNYEEFGLVNEISDYIDGGRVQMYVVDSNDMESWSNKGGDPAWRTNRQEEYFRFITEELVPYINSRSNSSVPPFTFGVSMGANHAALTFLRRPDLFSGMLSLSGVFTVSYFFDQYCDDTLYFNAPEMFMANLPKDHPYIDLYNQKKIIFCIGQGAWEEGLPTYHHLESVFREKGINAWFDYWGHDVDHDWPWWLKQIRYFMPYMLEDK